MALHWNTIVEKAHAKSSKKEVKPLEVVIKAQAKKPSKGKVQKKK